MKVARSAKKRTSGTRHISAAGAVAMGSKSRSSDGNASSLPHSQSSSLALSVDRGCEISYIVSLYHRPEYLAVCLWSLLGQNHQDFEVIITDNSEDNRFAERHENFVAGLNDSRFRYVRTYQKIEVPDCYWSAEYGIKMARGKWLCFPCEDCYYPPEWARRMLTEAMRGNWDLALCENVIAGPDTCGADKYIAVRVGTLSFPAYKPSFLVLAEKFKGWINKPIVPACSGVDRTTIRAMVYDPAIRWGAVRDLFYFHN